MKLILLHGRAQESFDELELKQTWIDTLNEGLAKSGLSLPDDVTIEFPYYGKLLEKIVNEKKTAPADPNQSHRSGQVYSEAAEIAFLKEYLGEVAEGMDASFSEKLELKALQSGDRGPLNWEPVQRLIAFIDRRRQVGSFVLKQATLDTFMYLKYSDIRKQIDDHVLQSFDDTPCVLVAHSMGTLIAYLLLKDNPHFQVKQFITLGSPLGLSSVQGFLGQPLVSPPCIGGKWFNAYDERDFVALNPLNKQYFNIQPLIENKSDVDNHTDNRHGIIGYLNDKEVAARIHQALVS